MTFFKALLLAGVSSTEHLGLTFDSWANHRWRRLTAHRLQIHWPGFPIANNWSTNRFVEGLARVKIAGLTKAVGVSNFKAERVKEASKILQVCINLN